MPPGARPARSIAVPAAIIENTIWIRRRNLGAGAFAARVPGLVAPSASIDERRKGMKGRKDGAAAMAQGRKERNGRSFAEAGISVMPEPLRARQYARSASLVSRSPTMDPDWKPSPMSA